MSNENRRYCTYDTIFAISGRDPYLSIVKKSVLYSVRIYESIVKERACFFPYESITGNGRSRTPVITGEHFMFAFMKREAKAGVRKWEEAGSESQIPAACSRW
jgi:hypothetical protein